MKVVYFIVAGVLAVSCSDLKITSDFDKEKDFDLYDSYVLLPWTQGDSLINKFDKERILNAVNKQMLDRGHAFNDSDPKLAVSVFLKLDNKTSTTAYSNYYGGYGYGYAYPGWGWGGGMGATTYSDYHYTIGTLVIDVYDTKSKQLIWQGVGAKSVDESPQTREQSVPKMISYIFKKYPKSIQKY